MFAGLKVQSKSAWPVTRVFHTSLFRMRAMSTSLTSSRPSRLLDPLPKWPTSGPRAEPAADTTSTFMSSASSVPLATMSTAGSRRMVASGRK